MFYWPIRVFTKIESTDFVALTIYLKLFPLQYIFFYVMDSYSCIVIYYIDLLWFTQRISA